MTITMTVTMTTSSALLFAESTRLGAVEVHVDWIEVALGGASWRIRQAMAVISFVNAILAKTARLAATTDDHRRPRLAFADAGPDFAHWDGVFASSIGSGSAPGGAPVGAAATAAS